MSSNVHQLMVKKPRRPHRSTRVNGILPSQRVVLACIEKLSAETIVTPKQIAYELGIAESVANARISRMKKAGLIRRGGLEIV